MSVRLTRCTTSGLLLIFSSLAGPAAHAQINAYLSAPNKTSAQAFSGARMATETFSSAVGNYTSDYVSATPSTTGTTDTTVGNGGTYTLSTTSAFKIVADDQYGSSSGNYMAFGAQSGTSGSITLSFTRTLYYFGMSWNAGDVNNGISFYNGNTLVGRYSTSDTINYLSGTSITAINGTKYQTSSYKVKPTGTTPAPSGTGEPYGYLNFFAANDASAFNRIVFDNSNSTSTGFESDNHTVVAANSAIQKLTAQGDFVSVGSSADPEPASFALLLPVVGVGGLYLRRRRTAKALVVTEQV